MNEGGQEILTLQYQTKCRITIIPVTAKICYPRSQKTAKTEILQSELFWNLEDRPEDTQYSPENRRLGVPRKR
jgi:hypothetical protein